MNLIKKIGILLLIAFASQSHAGLFGRADGMKKDCMEQHSRAWCLLDAVNMSDKVDDFSKVDAMKELGTAGNVLVSGAMIGTAVATNFFTPTYGLTKGQNITGMLLTVLTNGRPAIVGSDSAFAFMPIEMAENSEAAGILMYKMINDMAIKSFDGFSLIDATFSYPPENQQYSLDEREQYVGYVIRGGACEAVNCRLTRFRIFRGSYSHIKPSEGVAPDWMGGYKAWVFEKGSSIAIPALSVGNEFNALIYAKTLSKNLPEWVYISVTPQYKFKDISRNAGLTIPLIYNKGKAMTIVFPEIDIEDVIRSKSDK